MVRAVVYDAAHASLAAVRATRPILELAELVRRALGGAAAGVFSLGFVREGGHCGQTGADDTDGDLGVAVVGLFW